jgi:uncharacterized membrane protein YfcA
MTYFIIVFVTLCASAIGAVCGIGGGILIKPALDALGIMSVPPSAFSPG